MNKPLCIDLFCGLGGWTEAFIAEGYHCRGYDIEAHDYGTGGYPGELILRDVRSITGEECKDAEVIVASPPCQAYSYRAMPWKRAKALPTPDNTLFNECFRIQREASEAAGHYIPLIVENVRGAQKWVGNARWHYGSFYLWGDVPALMPLTSIAGKLPKGNSSGAPLWKDRPISGYSHQEQHIPAIASFVDDRDGRKVPGMNWSDRSRPPQGFNVAAAQRYREGVKNGNDWFGSGENCSEQRKHGSRSNSRKAASAMIAKIPYPLAQHIARVFKPRDEVQEIA